MARWEPISDALYATQIHHCDLCGRCWSGAYAGGIRREIPSFCDERCEQIWFDYWLPRYGKAHGFANNED